MRSLVVIALLIGTAACSTMNPQSSVASTGNGGCYRGDVGYTGARCPGDHP
jgi:hypothetical protein